MKKCYSCKKIKDLNLFYKNKSRSDGVCAECIECAKDKRKKHYLKNKDDICKKTRERGYKVDNKRKKLETKNLDDLYIKKLIRRDTNLKNKDIPDWLIIIKRQQVELERIIRKGELNEK
jgi:hypothetical protein